MGWSKWFGVGGGESETTKSSKTSYGTRKESLRTSGGSKSNHQHTWLKFNSSGKLFSGGSTPPKNKR